jgi:hypothetical protein
LKCHESTQRRDLIWFGGQAAVSALTAGVIGDLFAQRKPQPSPSSLEQRVAALLQAFDAQGNHRTGTEVDNASAQRLAHEARLAGVETSLEPFSLSRVDPQSCYLRIGEHRIDAVPLFDAAFTGPEGVEGTIGPSVATPKLHWWNPQSPNLANPRLSDPTRSRSAAQPA